MNCHVEGCRQRVSKAGHMLCLAHWKAERAGQLRRCSGCRRWHESSTERCPACPPPSPAAAARSSPGRATPPLGASKANESLVAASTARPPGGPVKPALVKPAPVKPAKPAPPGDDDAPGGMLSSTRVGRHFGLSSVRVNLILAELGWIEKYVKGWVPTDRGNALGAKVKEMRNGTPFAVWPASILHNPALLESVAAQGGRATPAPPADASADFRAKFPATFRTQDGHMVRSRAEVLIDNWLYMQGLVHAYERRLPIEEECYCDFYLPGGQVTGGKGVYIEFWGRESDPKYQDRQAAKRAIYAKHNLRLIELGNAEIERLDDVLPRRLLRFGIESF